MMPATPRRARASRSAAGPEQAGPAGRVGPAPGRLPVVVVGPHQQVDVVAVPRLEEWPFSDAPRHLRVKAVDKLPGLIEALVKGH